MIINVIGNGIKIGLLDIISRIKTNEAAGNSANVLNFNTNIGDSFISTNTGVAPANNTSASNNSHVPVGNKNSSNTNRVPVGSKKTSDSSVPVGDKNSSNTNRVPAGGNTSEDTANKSQVPVVKNETSEEKEQVPVGNKKTSDSSVPVGGNTSSKSTVEPQEKKATITDKQAEDYAKKLYNAGAGKWGTDEKVFADILLGLSKEDAKKIADTYKATYGETLEEAIEDEFSGGDQQVLLAALKGYTAKKGDLSEKELKSLAADVFKAVDGCGTDEELLIKAVAGLTKEQAKELAKIYKDTYGESLVNAIEGDTSGHLENYLVDYCLKGKSNKSDWI